MDNAEGESVHRLCCQLSYFFAITYIPEYARTFAPIKPASAWASVSAAASASASASAPAPSAAASGAKAGGGGGGGAAAPVAAAPFEEGRVVFERKLLRVSGQRGGAGLPDWRTDTTPLSGARDRIRLHTDTMEQSRSRVFTNFANKFLCIHQVIPSCTQGKGSEGTGEDTGHCTQSSFRTALTCPLCAALLLLLCSPRARSTEEVLFSAAPECYPGILISEVMGDEECILIRGLRRFNDYTGYLHTFTFSGFWPANADNVAAVAAGQAPGRGVTFDSPAIDSVMGDHFRAKHIIRDLNKGTDCAAAAAVSAVLMNCGADCPARSPVPFMCVRSVHRVFDLRAGRARA
jgi:hypothetical protein